MLWRFAMTTDTGSKEANVDGHYRYMLGRQWGAPPFLLWMMLNPSTADATEDDPTIRRCSGFAKHWGFGGLVVVNLFAFRATNPADLRAAEQPIGPENDRHLVNAARSCPRVVAAWGASCRWKRRTWQGRF